MSILFLLPVFIGLGCDTRFDYETPKYNVTGSCKLGLLDIYYLSKNKAMNENRYLHIKALNMQFNDNRAIYIYSLDDSKMLHHRDNIRFLNNLKYRRYYQLHSTNKENSIILKRKDGTSSHIKLYNDKSYFF